MSRKDDGRPAADKAGASRESVLPSSPGRMPVSEVMPGDQVPGAENDAAESATSRAPVCMTNGKVTLRVADGKVQTCSPEASSTEPTQI
jgi:hypothetical protein